MSLLALGHRMALKLLMLMLGGALAPKPRTNCQLPIASTYLLLSPCILRAAMHMVARGLARSEERMKRRSEDERKITAHHRLVVREREGVGRLSGAAFEVA